MNRRALLRGAIAAGIGASATHLLGANRARTIARPAPARAPLVPPSLDAVEATVEVWPSLPTTLQTYGGVYPSPILRARRGELVDLSLHNLLTEPTNIHWHGLTVPADMDGHPMDVVAPGGYQQYTFPVVDRAGTYWYHPHPDMLTASQVYRGMAGFFLVGDPDEDALGLPSGPYDVPLLLQDRRYLPDGSFTYAPSMMDLEMGYLGDGVLVNGMPDAEMKVAAAAYRFRFLNGSNARVFRLAFEDRRVFQVIGGDGGLLPYPVPAREIFLGPAERAEIYVDFSKDTSTPPARLVSLPFTLAPPPPGHSAAAGMPDQGVPMTILRLGLSGTGPAPALPTTLIPIPRIPRSRIRRQFIMNMTQPPMHGNFTINGLAYDAARVDVQSQRGDNERWVVINASDHPHPFHIHATQFRIVSRDRRPLGPHEIGLKDTLIVWPGEIVELAVRFDHYPGIYVFHCHNLEHEDAGMMATLQIV